MVEPVRPIALVDVEAARQNLAGTVLRTPLVRLELGSGAPEIHLKLENLQPTNAYKIRGATNAVLKLASAVVPNARCTRTNRAGEAACGVTARSLMTGIGSTDERY